MGRKYNRIYQQRSGSTAVSNSHTRQEQRTTPNSSLSTLQRTLGNQTLQRLIAENGGGANAIQTLLQTKQAEADSSAPDISRDDENTEMAQDHFREAMAEYEAGHYRRAIVRFERARQVPGLGENVYRDILFNIGRCNLHLERFATAIMYFEQYLEHGGEDTTTAQQLLEQARAATAQDAENILEREGVDIPAETDDPAANVERARALFEQADDLYQRHQFRQAAIIFEQLREMQNVDGAEDIQRTTLYNLARCNMRLRRYATAILYLEQYLEETEDEHDRTDAFDLLIEAQDESGAMNSREQIQFLFRLSQDAYDDGEYENVIRLSEAMRNVSGADRELSANIHYNIGLSFYQLGRYGEAVPHLRRYVEEHPGDQDAARMLTEAEERSGVATPEAATP